MRPLATKHTEGSATKATKITKYLMCSFVSFVCFVANPVFVASAQTLDRAEIHGTVRDETGGALDGVSIRLRDTRTSFERTVVTGRDGQYSAPLLPLGVYVVQADRSGFARTTSA